MLVRWKKIIVYDVYNVNIKKEIINLLGNWKRIKEYIDPKNKYMVFVCESCFFPLVDSEKVPEIDFNYMSQILNMTNVLEVRLPTIWETSPGEEINNGEH